jgi:hypothetical protein
MSEQIEPGDGWRLLGPDDVLRHGDEMLFHVDGDPHWMDAPDTCFGQPVAKYFPCRRRIPAKPEAMEIWNAFKVRVGAGAGANFGIEQMGRCCWRPSRSPPTSRLADEVCRLARITKKSKRRKL